MPLPIMMPTTMDVTWLALRTRGRSCGDSAMVGWRVARGFWLIVRMWGGVGFLLDLA
jgi:hypothetical protein